MLRMISNDNEAVIQYTLQIFRLAFMNLSPALFFAPLVYTGIRFPLYWSPYVVRKGDFCVRVHTCEAAPSDRQPRSARL